MKKSLFRIMALFLVLILILNFSPIRVSASALPEAAEVVCKVIPFNPQAAASAGGAALGVQVFGWVLAGLGLILSTVQLIELAQAYQEYSGDLEIGLYYYPDGTWSYGVDMNFVQRVHAFLFNTGVLVVNDELKLDSKLHPSGTDLELASAAGYSVLVYYTNKAGTVKSYILAYSNTSLIDVNPYKDDGTGLVVKTKDKEATINYFNSNSSVWKTGTGTAYASSTSLIISAQHFGQMIHPDVEVTIEGASIESVADPGTLDSDEGWQNGPYRDWHTNRQPARSPETGEKVEVLPIPLIPNGPAELPDGVTQSDVWNGSQAEMLPDMQPTPDGSLAQTPWDAVKKWVSDFFIPSGDITMYSLDLTELFPFCIPFDIFDLLSALRADPVAPVFELELDFGVTKAPITVDLSGWSDLASIIRILEVGLFCLGLALGTKELIGS